MINDYRGIGRMKLTDKYRSTRGNPVPMPFGTPKIPHKLVWYWTSDSSLTVRWLAFLDCMAMKMKLKARGSFRTLGKYSPAQHNFTRYKARIFSRTSVTMRDLIRQVISSKELC